MTRKFTSLNHPEPDEDEIQRYSVYEIHPDPSGADGKRYELVEDDLTMDEVDGFISANGERG